MKIKILILCKITIFTNKKHREKSDVLAFCIFARLFLVCLLTRPLDVQICFCLCCVVLVDVYEKIYSLTQIWETSMFHNLLRSLFIIHLRYYIQMTQVVLSQRLFAKWNLKEYHSLCPLMH